MKKIILASQSIGRKSLMERSGIPFEVMVSEYEEDHNFTDNPLELVKELALGKARDVAKKANGIIIGADTMVLFEGQKIGKPKSREEAYNHIKMLSGKTHSLITGYAVIDTETGREVIGSDETKVAFRELSDEEINDYLNKIEYHRFAGSYATDSYSMLFIEGIQGSHSNVVGLPMNKLAVTLKEMGVNVFKKK